MAKPSPTIDVLILYQIIRRLTTPFEDFPAYEMGLIDKKGKRLRKAKTKDEKKNNTYLDRFVLNLKRILAKVPGGDSKYGTLAAALVLLKEDLEDEYTEDYLTESIQENMRMLKSDLGKSYFTLLEDAPANATGAAVAGTGDDPVHWKYRVGKKGERRKYGRMINGTAFLRRAMRKVPAR